MQRVYYTQSSFWGVGRDIFCISASILMRLKIELSVVCRISCYFVGICHTLIFYEFKVVLPLDLYKPLKFRKTEFCFIYFTIHI